MYTLGEALCQVGADMGGWIVETVPLRCSCLRLARRKALFVCALTLCIGWAGRADDARRIAGRTLASVVLLDMEDVNGQPLALGSGFFIRPDIVATNLHVIKGAGKGYARVVGKKQNYDVAAVVAASEHADLALLRVVGTGAPTLPLGDSTRVAIGDEVYAVGNPEGLEGTFSQGIISGIRTSGSDTILQITAPISPGSSGGPVVDGSGEVIGVAVATVKDGQNLNFAIPSSYLAQLLSEVRAGTVGVSLAMRGVRRYADDLLRLFDGGNTEAVTGAGFRWGSPTWEGRSYGFSLRNSSSDSVEKIRYLVIFYDSDGKPLDFESQTWSDREIPPGLAVWVEGVCRTTVASLTAYVEIRILQFKVPKAKKRR